jgi:hypothetical protein
MRFAAYLDRFPTNHPVNMSQPIPFTLSNHPDLGRSWATVNHPNEIRRVSGPLSNQASCQHVTTSSQRIFTLSNHLNLGRSWATVNQPNEIRRVSGLLSNQASCQHVSTTTISSQRIFTLSNQLLKYVLSSTPLYQTPLAPFHRWEIIQTSLEKEKKRIVNITSPRILDERPDI